MQSSDISTINIVKSLNQMMLNLNEQMRSLSERVGELEDLVRGVTFTLNRHDDMVEDALEICEDSIEVSRECSKQLANLNGAVRIYDGELDRLFECVDELYGPIRCSMPPKLADKKIAKPKAYKVVKAKAAVKAKKK